MRQILKQVFCQNFTLRKKVPAILFSQKLASGKPTAGRSGKILVKLALFFLLSHVKFKQASYYFTNILLDLMKSRVSSDIKNL